MLLKDKTAIITGGSRGIGRAMVLRFAEEGCTTIIADIRQEQGQTTLKEVIDRKAEGIYINCDVTSYTQIQNMMNQVEKKYGKIDIMVNNAAISPPMRPFIDMTEDEWDKTLDVNLKSVFLCCKAVVPYMQKRRYGKIINVASLGALAPSRVIADYCAAKAGVVMLSRCLAADVAEDNICVNSLLPGVTRTDLHDAVRPPDISKDDYFAGIDKTIPLGRVADPTDIADAAVFLASDLSRYVTGDRILVSGGLIT